MIIIAAADLNNGIGNGNKLLFDIPEDKKFFKEKTLGNTVIMGRKTYDSLPVRPLPGRRNIVLTFDTDYTAPGAEICDSTEKLSEMISDTDKDRIFVIGGEQIYSLLEKYCDTAYITRIYSSKPADKYISDFEHSTDWFIAESSEIKKYEGIRFRFITYRRKTHHM